MAMFSNFHDDQGQLGKQDALRPVRDELWPHAEEHAISPTSGGGIIRLLQLMWHNGISCRLGRQNKSLSSGGFAQQQSHASQGG
jgi:hypothetical protein